MAQTGDTKPVESKPQAPSRHEYERLQRDAQALRQSAHSGEPAELQRRREVRGGAHAYMRYTGIGMQFALVLLIPAGLGYWLDGLLGTTPWLMVAGAVLGGVGSMTWVVRSVFRMEARGRRGEGENKP